MRSPSPIVIVGASARAAAQSALRSGWTPIAHDLFGDRDLHHTNSPIQAINTASYPDGFEALLAESPPGCPWIYTGALENHPELIDRMARIRPLWGISGDALRGCRDPMAVANALTSRGLPAPGVQLSLQAVPRNATWLCKPLASAGGRQIRAWIAGSVEPSRPSYYQERIDGLSLAAIFMGDGLAATFLGVTRQEIGHARNPFAYHGSLGPWPVSQRARKGIIAIGKALVEAFGLRGLFGVDLILTKNDEPFPVEVNPRYTASVEVLELALGRPLMRAHGLAFGSEFGRETPARLHPPAVVGKAILFADRRSTLPIIDAWRPRFPIASSFVVPPIADIPCSGQLFDEGDPVLTVLARGSTVERCEQRLRERLERWRRRLVAEG